MTSKNKYIKTLDKFLDIMKSKSKPSFYENEKDQIAEDLITACKKADLYDELTQEPTLSECIKEWEKRGYLCFLSKEPKLLDISNLEEYSVIKIGLENKHYIKVDSVLYSSFIPITFEEHNLIHKTIKALEKMEDE